MQHVYDGATCIGTIPNERKRDFLTFFTHFVSSALALLVTEMAKNDTARGTATGDHWGQEGFFHN
jgi:hypothetical protein